MIENFINSIGAFLATGGIKLLTSVVLLVVCWKLIGLLIKFLKKNRQFNKIDEGARGFLLSCISIILKVVLVLTVAANLGVPMTNIVAILGSCGLAIGLALQGSLANFAGGLMILVFHPFRVGDYISAPEQNVEGTVMEITVVYTVLRTYDGIEVTIPNGTLTNSVVKNLTTTDARRVDLPFRVDPQHPVAEVEAILAEVVAAEPRVLPDPAPFTRLTEVAGDALTYTVRIWCPNAEYWPVRFDLTRAVKDALDAHGIIVPRSQMDVHLDAATPDVKE